MIFWQNLRTYYRVNEIRHFVRYPAQSVSHIQTEQHIRVHFPGFHTFH